MTGIKTKAPKRRGARVPSEVVKMHRFSLAYDGPSLKDGGMDLLELAPAMVAMGKLLQSANARANGDRAVLNVTVYPLREGSMMIDLGSAVTLARRAVGLLGGLKVTKGIEIFKSVFGKDGVFETIKRIGGRPIEASKPDDKGNVTINVVNSPGVNLVVGSTVAAMVRDPADRRLAAEIVKPMKRVGIDVLKRIEGKREAAIATKDDVPSFAEGEERDELIAASSTSETDTILIPRNHPMYRGPKWRVRFPNIPVDFHVAMRDEEWLKQHDAGEIDLRPGDGLRVRLETRSFTDEKGEPAVEYGVLKVYGVDRGIRGRQSTLND